MKQCSRLRLCSLFTQTPYAEYLPEGQKGSSGQRRAARRVRRLSVVSLSVLCSCAPHLGRFVPVPDVPPRAAAVYQTASWDGQAISLETPAVSPQRPLGAMIDGRFVPIEGQVDAAVVTGLRQRLELAGASVQRDAPVALASRIVEWRMVVYPGFPSTSVEARAIVSLEAFLPSGEVAYRGTYTGEANRSEVNIHSSLVEDTLKSAMSHALDEIARDTRLIRAVREEGSINEP